MTPTTHTSAAGAMLESALVPPPSTPVAPPPSGADAYRHAPQLSLPLSPGQPMRRFASGKSKTGRQSSKFGTVNYSVDEMRRLNENVRAVMPIAGDDWLHVAYKFNYMRPESIPYREVDSLKRKFKKMYCSRASAAASGKLPDYIDEAKELRRLINLRAERAQLDASDSHSELDAQDVGHGLEHQTHALVSVPAAAAAAVSVLSATKTEAAPPASSSCAASTAGAPTESSSADDTQSRGERQLSSSPQDAASDVADPVPMDGSVVPQSEIRSVVSPAPQEPTVAAAAASFAQPSQDAYRELPSAKHTSSSHDTYERASPATVAAGASSAAQAFSDLVAAPSTSSVIAMLQQSIERKRRTIEDDVLSESERVRKERKKRKMEQVLLAIHHEQRERELLLSPMTASEAHLSHATLSAMTSRTAVPAAPPSSAFPSSTSERLFSAADATAPVSVLETVLQFLVAQQREHAAVLQQLRDERARERQLKSKRRREKERRRRREMRDLMRVMAAALGDAFPAALKHHLVADSASDGDDTDTDDSEDSSATTRAMAASDRISASPAAAGSGTGRAPPPPTTAAAASAGAQHIEANEVDAQSREVQTLAASTTEAAAAALL